ncbi:hypothetical protein [Mesorhizobium sp.]|uniref:hypothetical protein n=1 Tax=Mesorhizobium sp. TaxID=1871066 RepID=UPI000FE873C8|nr:hypothetical protein [Mesorhizobium sp.]RWE68085.1 MAG: hypothetical protein EOS62_12145 [Mesorhizobium sp.]
MEQRAERNLESKGDGPVIELDLGGDGPDVDWSALDDATPVPPTTGADASRSPEAADRAARHALITMGIERMKVLGERNKADFYPKKRKADREHKRLEYAIKIEAEQGRAVRPYTDLSGLTDEEKAARKAEQSKLRKRAQRQRASKP